MLIYDTIPIIEGCIFEKDETSTATNSIRIKNAKVINCSFTRLKVRLLNVQIKNSVIKDCGFEFVTAGYMNFDNCQISHGCIHSIKQLCCISR